MKRYKLKTEYKVILYMITLMLLLYMIANYNMETIAMMIYYFILYELIKTIKKECCTTGKTGNTPKNNIKQ